MPDINNNNPALHFRQNAPVNLKKKTIEEALVKENEPENALPEIENTNPDNDIIPVEKIDQNLLINTRNIVIISVAKPKEFIESEITKADNKIIDYDGSEVLNENHKDITYSDFDSFASLKSYLYSGAESEFNSKYDIPFMGGCQAAENIASTHTEDYKNVKKEQLLEELYQEYLKLYYSEGTETTEVEETGTNNTGNGTNYFSSFSDLKDYLLGGAYEDFNAKYNDITFTGGSQAAVNVAARHMEDYANVTKEQVLEELHEEMLRLQNENNNKEFSSYIELRQYIFGGEFSAELKNRYDFKDISYDYFDKIAERHKKDFASVTKEQLIEEYYQLCPRSGFSSYQDLLNYLQGDARDDFNKAYKDIEFIGGTNSARKVWQIHKEDFANLTKADILRELHAEFLKEYPDLIKSENSKWGSYIYLLRYVYSDAKNDFETKYPDLKFRFCCDAAKNVFDKFKDKKDYTRDDILEELHKEYQVNSENNNSGIVQTITPLITQYYNSWEELCNDLNPADGVKYLKDIFGITDFSKWDGNGQALVQTVLNMHKHDYQIISRADIENELLTLYFNGITDISGLFNPIDTEEIEKNPSDYYNNLLNNLIYELEEAETEDDYKKILKELNTTPLLFSKENDKNLDEYISYFSKTFGLSENTIRELYSNSENKNLFEKTNYIIAQCKANIMLNLMTVDYNYYQPGINFEDYNITFDSDGQVIFNDSISFMNEYKDIRGNNYASNYCKTLCKIIDTRLDWIKQRYNSNYNDEIVDLVNKYQALAKIAGVDTDHLSSLIDYDTNLIDYMSDDSIDIGVILQFLDNNYGNVIGDKEGFMSLVCSFYGGADKYSFEDCARILVNVFSSFEENEIPDREIAAKVLAQVLKRQDKDYENYEPLYNILEDSITQYLGENDYISISGFLEFCKSNNIYSQFRTEEEIKRDYGKALDKLNELICRQRDLINKYNGDEPPAGSSDAQLLEELKQQTEETQYLMNKYCVETSRENAEETFRQYFVQIMANICNTGLSEEEVAQALNNGTSLETIFGQETTTNAPRRGAAALTRAGKLSGVSNAVHNVLGSVTNSLQITKEVSSALGIRDVSEFSDKWEDYMSNGNDLINSYNDPQKSCNTIMSWIGVSTSFVSAGFDFISGDTESGARNLMIGTGYIMSPLVGSTLQNIVNIITAIEKYNKNPESYGSEWKNLMGIEDGAKAGKMKLIFDITLNVISGVANVLTCGLFGLASSALNAVQRVLTTSLGKVMEVIDKWSSKLFGKPLSELAANFWKHSGLAKLWKKSGLQKLCRLLGLDKIWNNIFKKKDNANGTDGTMYDNDGDLYKLLQDLMNTDNYDEIMDYINNHSYDEVTLNNIDVHGEHSKPYMRGEDTVVDIYTNGKKTGERVYHKDGSVDYYEINSSGDLVLVAAKDTAGNYTYYDTNSSDNGNGGTTNGNGGSGSGGSSSDPFGGWDSENRYYATLASWLINNGNPSLGYALLEWAANGCQGNFEWSATGGSGSNSGGNTGGGSTGSGGDWGNMGNNGSYAPDGTWNPIGYSGWGFGDNFLGVGGHGGTPVLGGGGGSCGNSYHS